MMQKENKVFDDLAKIVNGVAGTVAGMGREAQDNMRERTKEFVSGMDFVSREEFDAVKAMAAKARSEVDALTKRLDALEGTDTAAPAARKTPAKRASKAGLGTKTVLNKTAVKKAAPKKPSAPKKTAAPKKAAVKKTPPKV